MEDVKKFEKSVKAALCNTIKHKSKFVKNKW